MSVSEIPPIPRFYGDNRQSSTGIEFAERLGNRPGYRAARKLPLEALDELAHEFAGVYPPGYLDDLRNEWEDR